MWNLLLWIAQAFVAFVMLLAGAMKLVVSRERLAERMHWATSWPRERIKLLGLAEVAAAFGLVLPTATGMAPFLTPAAGLCVAILMIGAIRTHREHGEGFGGAVTIGALSLVVAISRGASFVH